MTVSWSDGLRHLLGTAPGFQPTIEQALNFYAPQDRLAAQKALQVAMTTGTPFAMELAVVTTEGRQIPVRATGAAVRNAEGEVVEVRGSFQDLSEISALAARHERLSRQFFAVLKTMRDGFVMLDAQRRVEYVNERGALILGCEAQPALGCDFIDLLPSAAPHLLNGVDEALAAPVVTYEEPVGRLDAWFEISIHRSEEGFAVYFHDVTQRKSALERSLAQAQRLTNIFNSLTDGFGTIDFGWRVTFANPAATQILRKPIEQLLSGQTIWELFPGLECSPFAAFYRNAMLHRRVEEMENYFAPLGLWLRARCFPVDEGVAVSFSDITAQKQAQQEVVQLNARLEQRVELRTQQLNQAYKDLESFSFMLAHDLRAPIRAVDGFSSFLQKSDEQQLGPKSRRLLDRIRTAAGRMEDLTQAILDLAKISYSPLSNQEVDLSGMCEEMLLSLAEEQPERRVRIQVQPGLKVQGDARLLGLVMQNLLGNAWKYSARSPQAVIEFGKDDSGCFFVRDNGCGFEDPSGRLFQPYCRLHSDEYEGTGLGLASVARAISRHGGHISAESRPGQGACFRFTLPGIPQDVPQ